MGNTNTVKKSIIIAVIYLLFSIGLIIAVNRLEMHEYNKNYNRVVNNICSVINEKYPEVTRTEIIEIINSKDADANYFSGYSMDLEKDLLVKENNTVHRKYLIIYSIIFIGLLLIPIMYFIVSEKKKNKNIEKIAKYIENINKGNYDLKIDDNTEDSLSILKNEVYKSTIQLKEAAEQSAKDRIFLKDSLSDISHQLKTPLTSLMINLDNLEENVSELENSEMNLKMISNAMRDTKKISFLVKSLLLYSKLDSNTIVFEKKETTLKKLIASAVENVSALSDLLGITIEVNCRRDDGNTVLLDEIWQTEALSNIVKNAVEHALTKVVISYESCEVYNKIEVSNDGKSISREDRKHLFERFYKGENSKKDSVGIGLSMAKVIVERDGGYITVDSDDTVENGGATFSIRY